MLFGNSQKQNRQEARNEQNPGQQQPSYPYSNPQGGYAPGGTYPGYGAPRPGYAQAPQGGYPQGNPQGNLQGNPQQGYSSAYGGAQNGYNTPGVGGGYFAPNQGTAPQGYAQTGEMNPAYSQGASQGYPRMGQTGAGYGQPGTGTAPGYGQMNPGSQGYPGVNQGGYPQQNQGAAPYGYPQQAGYSAPNPYQGYQNAGYGPQGGQSFAGYPQMGRTPQSAPDPRQGTQIPLNGGGYVPPAQKVRKPFVFNDARLIVLSAVLLILFIVGLVAHVPVVLWIYGALALASIAFFWIKPSIDTNKRLCFTIIFAALIVAAGVTLFTWSSGGQSDPTGQTPSGTQTTSQTSGSGTVVDPKTGQAVVTVALEAETPTPAPAAAAADDTSATDRLESFFYYWSVNKTDDMLTLCAPSWLSSVENARTSLFGLMANRTPLDYTVEKISGTVDDTSRTVTVTSTMDRNNGKDPVKYRLSVLMVKEGDQWYVDPQSLKTYEAAETQDPATVATPTPTAEPAVSGSTVLYYNPDGGSKYHLDQNCKSTHAKYLPMKGHFTYAEINDAAYANLEPCNVCAAPLRP